MTRHVSTAARRLFSSLTRRHARPHPEFTPPRPRLYTERRSSSTMPLSAVIIDDEQLARDELSYLLKSVEDVNIVAHGHNGLEAVNLIKEHAPDLVFLDVQMPGLDGFGVIKKLIDRKISLPQI